MICPGFMKNKIMPEQTVTVVICGFPRQGDLVKDFEDGTGLYYFPGDFIVGESMEAVLTVEESQDTQLLREKLADF